MRPFRKDSAVCTICYGLIVGVSILLVFADRAWAGSGGSALPEGFVDLKEIVPSIHLDMRYYSSHNFVGRKIAGYDAPRCILTKEAALALKGVQDELLKFSLSLKIYDAYRPKRAVGHFVRWAEDPADINMKKEFYPAVHKKDLFKGGYIAGKSSHSRGSTVDLTIIPLPAPEQEHYIPGQPLFECDMPAGKRFQDNSLDMGTGYDCMHGLSWVQNRDIGPQQRANRLLLKSLMEKYGFEGYRKEWWHFTLKKEPFPNTYFDFVIK